MDETDVTVQALRRATLDSCYKQLPAQIERPDSPFTDEEVESLTEILSQLTLEEQISQQFLVDIPPLEKKKLSSPGPPQAAAPQSPPPTPAPVKNPATDLDAWLDGLLS
jgi:hypothetical protein